MFPPTGGVQGCVQGCDQGMIHLFSHHVDDEHVNSLLLCFSIDAFFIKFYYHDFIYIKEAVDA